MTWYTVHDYLKSRKCYEGQKTGDCHCPACSRLNDAMQAVENLSRGMPSSWSIDKLVGLIQSKRCKHRHCNHRGCIHSEEICEWLRAQRLAKAA